MVTLNCYLASDISFYFQKDSCGLLYFQFCTVNLIISLYHIAASISNQGFVSRILSTFYSVLLAISDFGAKLREDVQLEIF